MSGSDLPDLPPPPEALPHRDYVNPPIQEAIVQVMFAEPLTWGLQFPSRFYDEIQSEYSGEPEVQDMFEASFDAGSRESTSTADVRLNKNMTRVVFKNDQANRLIVLNPINLSANSLPPYEGWPELWPRFQRACAALQKVSGIPSVVAVSVRYINRINVPLGIPTEDYFTTDIVVARGGSAYLSRFAHRVESVLEDRVTHCFTTLASAQTPENEYPIVLDIDFRRDFSDSPIALTEIDSTVQELRALEYQEFELSIKEKTRELFK